MLEGNGGEGGRRESGEKESERSGRERSRSKGGKKRSSLLVAAVSVAPSSPLLRYAFRRKDSSREIGGDTGRGGGGAKAGEQTESERHVLSFLSLFYFWPC